MTKRNRKIWSIKIELLTKSREAMLCAVQIFNNPNIVFKSESFVVLSNIAWTYLLHSFYRNMGIDYRYFDFSNGRKRHHKTKRGAFKYWDLERCLADSNCPVDKTTVLNLRFLIGLRHEIEHQMTTRIDDYLSARFQSCCLNYNHYVIKLFGEEFGIDKFLSFSLQFSSIGESHVKQLREFSDLPSTIASYIKEFDETITDEEFNSPAFSYRVLYVPKIANRRGQADKVIEFLPADSPEAEGLNKEYILIKDREKPKYLPNEIVRKMKEKGYEKFGMHHHTLIWKNMDAKKVEKGYGAKVAKTWYWYDTWLREVEKYCEEHKARFS